MFDKVINVPVAGDSVTHTLNSLPRTMDEAGLIEVTFKRKLEYKTSHHRGQLVNPKKLYKVLDHLKACNNPFYKFYDDINTFTERQEEEMRLHISVQTEAEDEIIDLEKQKEQKNNKKDKAIQKEEGRKEDEESEDEDEEEKEEREYREKDPVKKHQADAYGKSFMLADMYPEMNHESEYNAVTVAPGEGERPKNILMDKNWDVLAFPDLNSPDGKFGLHHPRQVKLTDQNFFIQTICNMEKKFAQSPPYNYAAVAYVEQKQIMRNLNMQGRRGKEVVGQDGKRTMQLEDGFAVLDDVKQTPRYWKKARYEMYAKLDNLGAFQVFFTLSCADLR